MAPRKRFDGLQCVRVNEYVVKGCALGGLVF